MKISYLKPAESLSPVGARMTGFVLMLLSALQFAALDGVIKLLNSSYRVWDIAFYRFAFGMAILLIVFNRGRNAFQSENQKLLVIRGVIGSLAFLSLVASIRLIPISTALVLFFSFPAFSALFSFLFLKERLARREIICIGVTLTGIMILFDFQMEGGLLGQALGLTGAFLAGVTICIIKKLRETNDSATIYLYFCLIGTVITFFPFISDPRTPSDSFELLMVAGIVFLSLAGQLLMNQGFKYCKSWEGGLFLSSEVLFTSVMGVVFLREPVTWRFLTGGLLILGSVWAMAKKNDERTGPHGD